MRCGVVATSKPPTCQKASSETNFSTVYRARSLITFAELVWKTSPGACELDPPVAGNGPWSTTVMSLQPRPDSSSASAAPTTPAPMMTTRGSDIRAHLPPGAP